MSSSEAIARSPSVVDNAVYVSLLPGTVPEASHATVHVVGSANSVITSVVDGGFDPVPIPAKVDDSIEVALTDASGASVKLLGLTVSARRPPVVVRTEPPPKKRDHPLNAAIVVVFSEPVAGGTLSSSSVQLFRGTTQIDGTVTVLQGTGATAALTPVAPLDSNTDYRLVITRGVRDREGDALAEAVTVAFTTGQSLLGPAASIQLSVDSVGLGLSNGASYQLTATIRDAAGNQLTNQQVTWSTSDTTGLTVSATGLLTARKDGFYTVTASVDGLMDTIAVGVSTPPGPPASVTVVPGSVTLLPQTSVLMGTDVYDARGNYLSDYTATWRTTNGSVATVDASGLVTAINQGSAAVIGTVAGLSDTVAIIVTPRVRFTTIAVGSFHTCGVTTAGATYCWGSGLWGVDQNQVGHQTGPIPIVGGLDFAQLDAGGHHTCGVTTTGAAYCWGSNYYGQLGDGDSTDAVGPHAVSGGHSFSTVSAGDLHTCGVSTIGAAYCWGENSNGKLGDGTSITVTGSQPSPVAVMGGLSFATVSASWYQHACGITTAQAAYCWGVNVAGELGDGTTDDRSSPVAVQGGLTFISISTGDGYTCGVTTAQVAYCWGRNDVGQLGDGTTTYRSTPVAVRGGLSLTSVSAGKTGACAVTTQNAAHCWGGGLLAPAVVPGNHFFAMISAGPGHICGVTTSGLAYCWGSNNDGQLGDGTATPTGVPVKVLGQP